MSKIALTVLLCLLVMPVWAQSGDSDRDDSIFGGASEPAAEVSEADSARHATALARDLAPGLPSNQIDHALALLRGGDTGAAIGAPTALHRRAH